MKKELIPAIEYAVYEMLSSEFRKLHSDTSYCGRTIFTGRK